MRAWDALSSTMRTLRTRRIGRREADQLLAGAAPADDRMELASLLAAAAAPARPEELAGEPAALAAFARARRETEPDAVGSRRRRAVLPPARRVVAVKVAAAVALAAGLGGTALAAETGRLPDPMQQRAHELFSSLGVPAADPTTRSSPRATGTPPPRPSSTGPAGGPAPGSADASTVALCRAWDTARTDPAKPLPADELKRLAKAAGGNHAIAAYCGQVLGHGPGTPPATPGSTPGGGPPTGPGNDRGPGNDPGGPGNGNPPSQEPGNGKTKGKHGKSPSVDPGRGRG